MSDTITSYFNDEWNEPTKKINNTLTKNQAIDILNLLYLHCGNKDEIEQDFNDLKNYIK